MDGSSRWHPHTEEHIYRMDEHAGVEIAVGKRKQVFHVLHVESRLLANLTSHAFLNGLVHIDEATNEVVGSLGRLLTASGHKELCTRLTA